MKDDKVKKCILGYLNVLKITNSMEERIISMSYKSKLMWNSNH